MHVKPKVVFIEHNIKLVEGEVNVTKSVHEWRRIKIRSFFIIVMNRLIC